MSQLASSVSKLESQGKLPSQTVINPKQNASAIVLRSGKELQENTDENGTKRGHAQKRKPEKEVEIQQDQDDETKEDNPKVLVTRPPFPERFAKSKKDEEAKEILETFRKVEVNIPLLDAIKQTAATQDFSRNYAQQRAMCDLGASINVMPLSIFESLHVGPLKETGVVIQLADRSVVYPEGVLEDILVQVNELVFPADFYVLDMREDNSPSSTSILLGRPFLKTARTKIDVHSGTLSMEFDGEIIKFNIYDSMRYPSDIPTALLVDIVDPLVQALSSTNSEDHVKFVLEESLTPVLVQILAEDKTVNPNISTRFGIERIAETSQVCLFGRKQHIAGDSLKQVKPLVEEKLIRVLREFKEAIGWTIADIKGLSPSTCMHRILLEEGTKPSREAQRRLNPPMMEVVKKEILKLLDAGFHQIPVAPADQDKTTFTCPFGTFAYRRMPFGLCNVPATFQRCMVSIFSDFVEQFIEVFMDDFTAYGDSFDDCLEKLTKVLERCIEKNLVLNYEKCHFMVDQGLILGHIVSSKGIEVDKSKIDAIKSLPYPASVREIHSFLGHAGFYRRFIKDFSKIAQPLCTLLQKDANFEFDGACAAAFDKLKESLTSAPVIRSPDWNLSFEIICDASNHAIGAVLGQRIGKEPHVIYYASRMLDNTQSNYTTTEKELLAVVFALEKFRHYLLGTKVVVFSDHAALKYLLSKKEAKPRLIRWILLLQEFPFYY
ncbi:Retrovirus-related Pol polyprotein from transposon.6 [Sesamum angolense]|uniref:RNA-directed DNA polymerase n=1 Tax=Sesamum angolense TaxID=2727404 RepID=A0AAE2C7G6_9LAMI|nr:Retrovirus-related Pol polyprotein from transposon.6 [Sesamum angolense]